VPVSDRSEAARGVPGLGRHAAQCPAGKERPAGALGRLPDGTLYFAPLGEIAYDPDEDRVQCHLCGQWYRVIAGSHLQRVHGWTLDEYRDAFRLPKGVPTVAAGVSAALAAHTRRRVRAGELPGAFTPEWRARADNDLRRRVPRWRSLAGQRPEQAAELHPTRNGDLDPGALAPTSSRRVWWRCPSCGHEWKTSLAARTRGDGCRECAKRAQSGRRLRVRPGQSLAELSPDLAAELHPTRNGDLNANEVARWSVLPVWWRCRVCGHDWEVSPRTRAGCPWCAAHRVPPERSLAILRPELAAELHPTRNRGLDPKALGASSSLKLWWRCAACGREWKASVVARSSGGGACRSCLRRRAPRQRSLALLRPELATQLHPTRNGDLDPETVAVHSRRVVWWCCPSCGREWKASIQGRAGGQGRCPGCRRLATTTNRPTPQR
jgi:rubrerythrin